MNRPTKNKKKLQNTTNVGNLEKKFFFICSKKDINKCDYYDI